MVTGLYGGCDSSLPNIIFLIQKKNESGSDSPITSAVKHLSDVTLAYKDGEAEGSSE